MGVQVNPFWGRRSLPGVWEGFVLRPVAQRLKVDKQLGELLITERGRPSQVLFVAVTLTQPLPSRQLNVAPLPLSLAALFLAFDLFSKYAISVQPAKLNLGGTGAPFKVGVIAPLWVNIRRFYYYAIF